MSDGKNRVRGVFGGKNSALLKNAGFLAGWIAALILAAGLCWFLTQPLRIRLVQKAVNQTLEQSGDLRRLGAAVKAALPGTGFWYEMTKLSGDEAEDSGSGPLPEGARAFVFAFSGAGVFFPCAAVVFPGGTVEEFIPLGSHGERMMKRVPRAVLGIYARRIGGKS